MFLLYISLLIALDYSDVSSQKGEYKQPSRVWDPTSEYLFLKAYMPLTKLTIRYSYISLCENSLCK